MKDIYCLAIESSCDETSMSIIKNGCEEIKTIVNTQIDIHKKFGGVVPEIASRSHAECITIVIDDCLTKLEVKMDDKIVWFFQTPLAEFYKSSKANDLRCFIIQV